MKAQTQRAGLAFLGLLALISLPVVAQDGWRLPGLDGGALVPADLSSSDTVVVVWAGWSPRCRDIASRIATLGPKVGEKARLISVDFQEDEADIRDFLDGKPFPVPIYLDSDGTFSRQHRVTALPGWVIYRDGKVVHQGKLPTDPGPVLRSALP